jgi:hypothetical protein
VHANYQTPETFYIKIMDDCGEREVKKRAIKRYERGGEQTSQNTKLIQNLTVPQM